MDSAPRLSDFCRRKPVFFLWTTVFAPRFPELLLLNQGERAKPTKRVLRRPRAPGVRGPRRRPENVLQGRVRRGLRERLGHRERHCGPAQGAGAERGGSLRRVDDDWLCVVCSLCVDTARCNRSSGRSESKRQGRGEGGGGYH